MPTADISEMQPMLHQCERSYNSMEVDAVSRVFPRVRVHFHFVVRRLRLHQRRARPQFGTKHRPAARKGSACILLSHAQQHATERKPLQAASATPCCTERRRRELPDAQHGKRAKHGRKLSQARAGQGSAAPTRSTKAAPAALPLAVSCGFRYRDRRCQPSPQPSRPRSSWPTAPTSATQASSGGPECLPGTAQH